MRIIDLNKSHLVPANLEMSQVLIHIGYPVVTSKDAQVIDLYDSNGRFSLVQAETLSTYKSDVFVLFLVNGIPL